LAEQLRSRYQDIEVELIGGSGGAFEVRLREELIFSKLRSGRFPEPVEIFAVLDTP
jgi:selT/selW/selH-like putative selenoprotein